MGIKAILFDFDGVLTTDATGSTSICNYISKQTGISLENFKNEYYKYNNDLLCGKIMHTDMWDTLCKNLSVEIDIMILIDSFINTPIDNKMIMLAERLKEQGYKIGMITDNKKDRIDCIVKHHKWENLFDIITVSADVGSGKDNIEIFLHTLSLFGLNADECVFIDNSKKNLIIPNEIGMNVVYFDHITRNFDELLVKLQKLDIN